MVLGDEQAKTIKEQLLKQIDSFPEDQREGIIEYINSMNPTELEEFLIKNNLLKQTEEPSHKSTENSKNQKTSDCIYCLLANKKIPSSPIYEDKDYLAVLEIKPLSTGHTVLIPKEHVDETKKLKAKAMTLANKIGKYLVKRLDAENFQVSTSDELKHAIINIVPKIKGKELNYKRPQSDPKELQQLATKIGELKVKKKEKKPKQPKETNDTKKPITEVRKSNLPQMNRRIP